MTQDMFRFLPAAGAGRWLVVESFPYLPGVCRRYPGASITVVTRFEEAPELPELRALPVTWAVQDFRAGGLAFPHGSFDFVLAESCLTEAGDPDSVMMELSGVLTDTGTLYTQFRNIRYQGILEQLRCGAFRVRSQHYYAKSEVVRLLNDALFKEIFFLPGQQDEEDAAEKQWQERGFEDFSRDLATAVWFVRASRSTASVANLKSLYSRPVRARLSRLLHRIEYGIDTEKSVAALHRLCREQEIFPEYLDDFIHEACLHEQRVHDAL